MTKLSDLKIDEVSLVRKGANQHAHVAIAKSAEGEPGGIVEEFYDADGNAVDIDELENGSVVYTAEGEGYQIDDDYDGEVEKSDDRARNTGAFSMLSPAAGGIYAGSKAKKGKGLKVGLKSAGRSTAAMTGHGLAGGAAGSGLGAAAGFAASRGKAEGAAIGGAIGGYGGALGGAYHGAYKGGKNSFNNSKRLGYIQKSFQEEVEVELSKALTDEDRDAVISKAFGYMEELEEVAKAAAEMAEAERDARLDAEFLEVAKSYELPIDDEELADALRAIAEALDPEQIEVVRKCLELASISGFDEFGKSGGGDNNDIMTMVESVSADVFSKSAANSVVSKEQIIGDAFAANPELYDQYLLG